MTTARRPLNFAEVLVLRMIQDVWGPQNTEAAVFFTKGEALIFAEDTKRNQQVAVNLTNLGSWFTDGSYSRDDVLRAIRGPLGE